MADGEVRGAFSLEARAALDTLGAIRDKGAEADTSLASLGSTMDHVGSTQANTRLGTYKRKLTEVAKAAEDTAVKVATSWDAQYKSIDKNATRIEGRIDRLQARLNRYGESRSSAEISLSGFDRVNAQLQEVELRLDSIARRNATARVSVSGGGAGGLASSAASSGGGFSIPGGFLGKLAVGGLALSPGIFGLAGGATALAGSATSAALGAGATGLAGYGTVGAGAALSAGAIIPAVKNLGALTTAQQKYTQAVQAFGRASSQAAAAKRTYDAALAGGTPAEVAAASQLGLLRGQFTRSTAAGRASVYRGASSVIYDARRGLRNGVSGDINRAAGATSSAATAFGGFLTGPQQIQAVGSLTSAFVQNAPIMERTLQNTAVILERLAVDSLPFFREADVWVEQWTAGLERSSGDTQKVDRSLRGMVQSAKDWGHLGGAMFDTVRDIFEAGTPSGNSMVVQLTDTFRQWDQWIEANPGKVSSWFTQAATTTDHIAKTVGTIVSDLFRLANQLTPLFNRGMDLLNLAGGIGGGGLGGVALLAGGYKAAGSLYGSATGRAAPGAGRAAAAFVTGSGAPLRSGSGPARAVTAMGGGGRTIGRASHYEAATGRTSGGAFLMPGVSEGPQSVIERRAAAAEDGGSTRLGRARSSLTNFAESNPAVARVVDSGAAASGALMDAAGAVGKFLAPMIAIEGLIGATSTKGDLLSKLGGGVNAATFGLVPSGVLHSAFGVQSAGASLSNRGTSASVRRTAAMAGSVSSLPQLRRFETRLNAANGPAMTSELPASQAASLHALYTRLSQEAIAGAGAGAAETWGRDFAAGLEKNKDPEKSVQLMVGGMEDQLHKLGPGGQKAFLNSTAKWVGQMEADNPKLRAPLNRLMKQLTGDFTKLQQNANGTMQGIQQRVVFYNGQILTGSQKQWAQISANIINPIQVAQEKVAGSFATMQQEAVNALVAMGFSKAQAAGLVRGLSKGGGAGVAAGVAVTGQQAANAVSSVLNETGGIIPGSGLLDTVNVGNGQKAAPGEAWIANRHTMNDLSSATLAKYGKTAWQMIRDETRTHSSGGGFATGGGINIRPPALNGLGGIPLAMGGADERAYAAGLSRALNNNSTVLSRESGGSGPFFPVHGGPVPAKVQRAKEAAIAIAHMNLPYGHEGAGWGLGAYDCSSYESTVFDSAGITGWGPGVYWTAAQPINDHTLPGPGKWITVGTKGTSGNNAHTMFEIDGMFFESSGTGSGPHIDSGWSEPFDQYRHPAGFARGGQRQGQPGHQPTQAEAMEIQRRQRMGRRMDWGGWNRRGGSFLTNGATLFGAGENGHERVSITPINQKHTGGGVTVNMAGARFYGVSSSTAGDLAEQVAERLLEALNRVGQGASDAQLMGADA